MKYFWNILKYFFYINVGDGQKEKTDDDSYDSSKTQSYVASNEDDSDEFGNSNNEPVSKKVFKRSDFHLSLKKKEVTVGSLANKEDHMVKPIQRLQNLYLWSK